MCGRYVLQNKEALEHLLRRICDIDEVDFEPRYNVAPSQTMPVVAGGDDAKPRLSLMRWGLVPFWEKSDKPKIAPINARSEDVLSKPMFRQSVQKRRCVVPADGFYEWKRTGLSTKIPHFISLRERTPFFFAGIYETATDQRPATYALLTTQPNALMQEIHNRMPVILTESVAREWLQSGPVTSGDVARVCVPFPAEAMQAYPISALVNNPRNDRAEILEPAAIG